LTTFANFCQLFLYFDGGSQLPQQILWSKFHIRCAYFTPNCTWSPNYSVLVSDSQAAILATQSPLIYSHTVLEKVCC
jgi:hypothetical protein